MNERLIQKEVGQKIRHMRTMWGLSQIELAEKMGISFQQIQKYEKGVTRISVMRLQQISEVLGVKITAFFDEGESIPRLSGPAISYRSGGEDRESFSPLNKEEITLLKLFRKTRNKGIREGVLKLLRGVIQVEKKERETA
ncbi:MAG: helix-turn-helix transcriptional regulator [Deltaproteobacteria bacterium]|nr:helix-turn-helix transcriptional regulator [Deltaproteobacteria bacterium]